MRGERLWPDRQFKVSFSELFFFFLEEKVDATWVISAHLVQAIFTKDQKKLLRISEIPKRGFFKHSLLLQNVSPLANCGLLFPVENDTHRIALHFWIGGCSLPILWWRSVRRGVPSGIPHSLVSSVTERVESSPWKKWFISDFYFYFFFYYLLTILSLSFLFFFRNTNNKVHEWAVDWKL